MRVPEFSLLFSFFAVSVLAQGDLLGEVIYVRAEEGAGSASLTTLTTSTTSFSSPSTSPSEPASTSASGSIPAAAIYNSSASNSSSTAHSPINANASTGLIFGGLYLDEPGLPQAKQPTDSVPADAVTYAPNGTDFDVKDFNQWSHDQYFVQKKRFMVVKAGTYNYVSAEDEFNKMMSFWLYDGATLDLRGCTFTFSMDPETNPNAPNNAIYIDVTDNFTILGGTWWIDAGELYSQARIAAMTPTGDGDTSLLTIEIGQGYDKNIWKTANARNIGCLDVSDPNHYTRPSCNFWYLNDIKTNENGTITATATSRSQLKEGYVLTMSLRENMPGTIAAEACSGLKVKGVTTNGAFSQYGLGTRETAVYNDLLIVNLPPREGFAPRVEGPTLSWRNIENFNFCADCKPPQTYVDCWWQYTGAPPDLKDMADQKLPAAGT